LSLEFLQALVWKISAQYSTNIDLERKTMKKTFFCAVFAFASMCVSIPTSHAQHISTGSMKATIKIMLRQSEDKKEGQTEELLSLPNKKFH
jgi:hypothetical protein